MAQRSSFHYENVCNTRKVTNMGEVAILNVGAGDTKITFDKDNPEETARAAGIVEDMLKRGYALLIEAGRDERGPLYRRALGFDPQTCEYIVAGDPHVTEEKNVGTDDYKPGRTKSRSKRGATSRVPASGTNAVAVARTSGG